MHGQKTRRHALVAGLLMISTLTAPAAATARPGKMGRAERAVVRKVNALRAGSGAAALRGNGRLARAADSHSRDMLRADFFDHPSSNGTSTYDRVRTYRRSNLIGETLAYMPVSGGTSAQQIVNMWMASQGHRDVLMDGRFRRSGVAKRRGTLFGTKVTVWTADLISAR